MDKLSIKESTETRVNLYEIATEALNEKGFATEPIKGGVLVSLADGYFAKLALSVCDATKFDLEATRTEYADIVAAREERAAKAKAKVEEKAAKAAEREAAKAAKEAAKE